MISDRLKFLYTLSIPLFILHGIEEYLTKFYDIYPLLNFKWTENVFSNIPQATFLFFQIMWLLLLLVLFLVLKGNKTILIVMTGIGLVYIYECTHILSAVILRGYTPGFTTGLLFPILGFFYWKELLKTWRVK